MFSSLSACVPNSQVVTSFVSSQQQLLDISANVQVSVNGTVSNIRPVVLANNDAVSATVTTSNVYLGYDYYEYTLNNSKNYFAVVNKNNYTPTVKVSDQGKRWFNYNPPNLLISFYSSPDPFQRPLGFGKRIIEIAQTHIVLDHINNAVCFYANSQELLTRVTLPSGPIAYQKATYTESGIDRTEAIILCSDKRIYRIRFDNRFLSGDEYSPTVIPVEVADNLWFEQDLPTGESFLESRRNAIRSKTRPPTTALDIASNYIWIGGYDAIYVLSRSFQQLNKIDLPNELIVDIAHFNTDAFALGRNGKLFYISRTAGSYSLILEKAGLGSPCTVNTNKVVVPDPNSQQLLIFTDSSGTYQTVATPDFASAYARVFDSSVWVTGHDTNQVWRFNSELTSYEIFYFDNKVTIVSSVPGSLLAVHYLQDFVTLDLTGIKKVIPIALSSRSGPLTHIGTDPVELKMLGEESLVPVAGPGITAWINGISGETAKTGDYLGVSYRAEENGQYRSFVLLGDSAFDYDVTVQSSTENSDYFQPNAVATNRLSGILGIYTPPDVGDLDAGKTGPIPLGFNLNLNGRIYNEFYVTTNGYITFEDSTPYAATGFGGRGTDPVLYVDPGNLIQSGAINNVNPENIYYRLDSNETPGVYFKTGTLGDFNYFRVRWVGTEYSSNLSGTTHTVTSNTAASYSIPLTSLQNVEVGNYVSGNFVSNTTQVSNVVSYNRTVDLLKISVDSNRLHINNLSNFQYETYSSVIGITSGNVDSVDLISNVSITSKILAFSGNVIKASLSTGIVDSNFYSASIPLINGTSVIDSNIANIVLIENNITAVNVLDSTRFTVGEQEYSSLYVGQLLFHPNIGSGYSFNTISGKSFSEIDGFIIRTVSSHSLVGGESITAKYADIVFSQPAPTNTLPGGDLLLFNYSLRVSDSSNFENDSQLILRANIAVVEQSLSLQSGQPILFANNYAAPAKTYEVGFYQGRNYQYIEYFYDSQNHNPSANIGLVVDDTEIKLNVNTGISVVFYSNISDGQWQYSGVGSFNQFGQGFVPRGFNYIKSIVENAEQDRIEIYFDRNLSTSSNVLIAADYGFLSVNAAVYTGNSSITEGSVISLTAPLNDSRRAIAPMLSIGDYQLAVPMISRNAASEPSTITYLYGNQPSNTLVNATVTIPVSGTYYLPNYFRNPTTLASSDIAYQRIRSEVTTDLTGLYHELIAGDQITVLRQLTPRGLYNFVDADLVGPVHIKIRWQTSAGTTFNFANYGTLSEPYTRLLKLSETEDSGVLTYEELDDSYRTANLTLTSNSVITGTLYVDTPESNIIVNGTVGSNLVTNVSTGANIALQRRVLNYFQANVDLYQIKYDSITQTNVYIPVGIWEINNRVVTGDSVHSGVTNLVNSYAGVEFVDSSSVVENILEDVFVKPITVDFGGVEELLHTPQYLSLQANTVEEQLLENNKIVYQANINFENVQYTESSVLNLLPDELAQRTIFSFGLVEQIEASTNPLVGNLTQEIDQAVNSIISGLVSELTDKFSVNEYRLTSDIENAAADILTQMISRFEDRINVNYSSNQLEKLRIETNAAISTRLEIDQKTNYKFSSLDSLIDTTKTYHTQPTVREITSSISYLRGLNLAVEDRNVNKLFETFVSELERYRNSSVAVLESEFDKIRNEFFINNGPIFDNSQNKIFNTLVSDLETVTNYESKQFDILFVEKRNMLLSSLGNVITSLSTQLKSEITSSLTALTAISNLTLDSELDKTKNIITSNTQSELFSLTSALSDRLDSELQLYATTISNSIDELLASNSTIVATQLESLISSTQQYLSQVLQSSIQTNATVINKLFEIIDELDPTIIAKPAIYQFDGNVNYVEQLLEANKDSIIYTIEQPLIAQPEISFSYLEKLLPTQKDQVNQILYQLTPQQPVPVTTIHFKPDIVKIEQNHIFMMPEYIFDRAPEYKVQMVPDFEIRNYEFVQTIPELISDIPWISDDITKHGTTKTMISIWADNGRAGDKVTNQGTPPDPTPFVRYTKQYDNFLGGYTNGGDASAMAVKYVSASAFQIIGTDFWNYRIYFNNKHYCVPRRGTVFPIKWFIRGG
jgi:hypothetical protein